MNPLARDAVDQELGDQRDPLDRRRQAVPLRRLLGPAPEQLGHGPASDAAPVGID